MELGEVMETIAQIFEVVGVFVLVIGGCWTVVRAWRSHRAGGAIYEGVRRDFGRSLLLGLEILVAADIVKTVSATTLDNVVILGILVLVRTLLSFSLDVEIDGVAPWRRLATVETTKRLGRGKQASSTPE